jgi:hypothetical protein
MVYVIQIYWQLASRIRMDCSSILILLNSWQQTCMTYTTAVWTVKNSWCWTKELSETCRISFQEYIWEISASSWFSCYIYKLMLESGACNPSAVILWPVGARKLLKLVFSLLRFSMNSHIFIQHPTQCSYRSTFGIITVGFFFIVKRYGWSVSN